MFFTTLSGATVDVAPVSFAQFTESNNVQILPEGNAAIFVPFAYVFGDLERGEATHLRYTIAEGPSIGGTVFVRLYLGGPGTVMYQGYNFNVTGVRTDIEIPYNAAVLGLSTIQLGMFVAVDSVGSVMSPLDNVKIEGLAQISAVPEPAQYMYFLSAFALFGFMRRRMQPSP